MINCRRNMLSWWSAAWGMSSGEGGGRSQSSARLMGLINIMGDSDLLQPNLQTLQGFEKTI